MGFVHRQEHDPVLERFDAQSALDVQKQGFAVIPDAITAERQQRLIKSMRTKCLLTDHETEGGAYARHESLLRRLTPGLRLLRPELFDLMHQTRSAVQRVGNELDDPTLSHWGSRSSHGQELDELSLVMHKLPKGHDVRPERVGLHLRGVVVIYNVKGQAEYNLHPQDGNTKYADLDGYPSSSLTLEPRDAIILCGTNTNMQPGSGSYPSERPVYGIDNVGNETQYDAVISMQ
jgi:hypothetical protein